MAIQTTGAMIVYLTVCSAADHRKHQSPALLAFVGGNSPVTGEFPAQRASNAENASIWWRHDDVVVVLNHLNNILLIKCTNCLKYFRGPFTNMV